MLHILYRFLTSLACLAPVSVRSKDLEIIVLRHQLSVLQPLEHALHSRPPLRVPPALPLLGLCTWLSGTH